MPSQLSRWSNAGRQLRKFVLALVLYLLLPLACLEAAIEYILEHPRSVAWLLRPTVGISHLKNYYAAYDRPIVQYRPECVIYDDVLSYRLRPGSCVLTSREGTVKYEINRAGLRDTDAKLTDHSVDVLGDSHAMGWNVDREKTFAERLGALTKRQVLNTAIASYETAREMALLREVILPSSEYIIIQYCDNDFSGNWQSVIRAALPSISRAEFEEAVNQHVQVTRYYPFKHIRYLIPSAWKMFSRQIRNVLAGPAHAAQWTSSFASGPRFEAMTFLSILDSNRELLRGRHLIVFEINGNNQNNTGFAAAVRRAAARTPLLKELASMHVIDMSEVLNADDYFLLDDHINAGGHEKVAQALAGILRGDNRWRVEPAADEPSISVSGASGGRLDAVERKGSQAVITGWAPRNRNGEPPESLVLLRNGKPIAETEPVFRSDEPNVTSSEPAARRTGFAFAVRADLITPDQPTMIVSKWKDGEARPITGEIH